MSKHKIVLSAAEQRMLQILGNNIRLARLRRKLSSEIVAEKASISRPTLIALEGGETGVSIGHIIQVLCVLGLEKDIKEVACDDDLKLKQKESGISPRKRAPKSLRKK